MQASAHPPLILNPVLALLLVFDQARECRGEVAPDQVRLRLCQSAKYCPFPIGLSLKQCVARDW